MMGCWGVNPPLIYPPEVGHGYHCPTEATRRCLKLGVHLALLYSNWEQYTCAVCLRGDDQAQECILQGDSLDGSER